MPARRWTAGRPRAENRHSLAAYVVGIFSVDGEGGSGRGEVAETSPRKSHLGERRVGDVRRRSARDERNADPNSDRSAEIGILHLAGSRNGFAAALGEAAASIDAFGIGLLGPGIGVPGEIVDARETMLGGCQTTRGRELSNSRTSTGTSGSYA